MIIFECDWYYLKQDKFVSTIYAYLISQTLRWIANLLKTFALTPSFCNFLQLNLRIRQSTKINPSQSYLAHWQKKNCGVLWTAYLIFSNTYINVAKFEKIFLIKCTFINKQHNIVMQT